MPHKRVARPGIKTNMRTRAAARNKILAETGRKNRLKQRAELERQKKLRSSTGRRGFDTGSGGKR